MAADPVGREILAARPDIKEETVRPEALRALPEGSFGREYARFMDHHGWVWGAVQGSVSGLVRWDWFLLNDFFSYFFLFPSSAAAAGTRPTRAAPCGSWTTRSWLLSSSGTGR